MGIGQKLDLSHSANVGPMWKEYLQKPDDRLRPMTAPMRSCQTHGSEGEKQLMLRLIGSPLHFSPLRHPAVYSIRHHF